MSVDYPWAAGYVAPPVTPRPRAVSGGPAVTLPYAGTPIPPPRAVPGGPAVTLPYAGVPLGPAPAGAGVVPARPREADYPFSPSSPTPATSAGAGGSRAVSGGPMVTMPYSGTTLAPAPAGAGVVPARAVPMGDPGWDGEIGIGRSIIPERTPTPPTPPPPPPPPGAGGGAAGGASSWQELFDQQRAAAERARQNLDREFASRRDDLRSQYQFAETDQERAQLAFLMAELESATERADQAILAGYANAVQNIQQLGTRAGAAADFETQAVQNLFLGAGERFAGQVADVQAQTGLQAGLAGTSFGPAEDFLGLISADAARESALAQRMGGIVSEEMTDAERRMAFQQASQQADLQRASMSSGAQTRADQQAAVANRIALDRRNFTDNLRQLQSTYASLGASFDQAGIASYGEQAGLAQSEALFLADLASRERVAAANRAAQLDQLERQWAREDERRPEWQTDDLAAALLAWDLKSDIDKARPGAFERHFGGLLPGVEAPGAAPGPGSSRDFPRPDQPAQPSSPPLVEIPDEDLDRERARRDAQQFETEARAYYNDRIRTIQDLVNRGVVTLPPGATVQDRALAQVQSRFPGWQP